MVGLMVVMKFRPKKSKLAMIREILGPIAGYELDEDEEEMDPEEITVRMLPPTALQFPQRRRSKVCSDVLRIHLHHGDILIQQGPLFQKYYEVSSFLV